MKCMTIDDLYDFCQSQNLTHFSSNESGYELRVQVPSCFSKYEENETMLFADIKIFHTGRNRNGSALTDKAAKHCMDTLAYKPLLANFTDVNGEWDFTSHDFEEVEHEDGTKETIYYEKQIGCFTADKPYKQYDEEFGHDYIYGRVAIPRDYTKAADIIERKNGTKVSVELAVLDMAYSAKDKTLMLNDAIVCGCTCLGVDPESGEEIGEGMVDAHISLESFSEKNNAIFTDELINELKKFNANFESLNINKQGGREIVNRFNELLAKYNVTAEDIEFEYEGLSDEELEAKFAEVFGNEDDGEDAEKPEETESEVATEEASEDVEEAEGSESEQAEEFNENEAEGSEDTDAENVNTYSLTLPDGTVKQFSLSLNDVQNALLTLVNDTYGEIDNDWYDIDVYMDESKVVFYSWWSGKAYRQSYKRKKDTFSLDGERTEVKRVWVSELEQKALDDMKANYSVMESKLNAYESEPDKIELINSEDYAQIRNTEEFAEISKRENYFEMSKEDLAKKLDDMLLAFAKNNKIEFSAKTDNEPKKVGIVKFANVKNTSVGRGRYGGIFSKKD